MKVLVAKADSQDFSSAPTEDCRDRTYLPALDWLRLAAIVLVTLQHSFAITGLMPWTRVGDVSIGQIGVGLFCAISGYLAFASRHDSHPFLWLKKRLAKLYPAYWLAMLFSFAAASISDAKPFSLALFVSQMLGTGFFTHGWALVNVASWFVSLILLCYLMAALIMLTPQRLAMAGLFLTACIYLVATRGEVDLSRHLLSFFLGALAAMQRPAWQGRILTGFGVVFLLLQTASVQFAYACISAFMLATASVFNTINPPWLNRVASRIYEYFLIHGVLLVASVKLIHTSPWLSICIGIAVSIVAAETLRISAKLLSDGLGRTWRALRNPA